MAAEDGAAQRLPVFRRLGDRLAEEVRLEQAACHIIKGDQQVMEGDRSREVWVFFEEFNRLTGGDVLHDDVQTREGLRKRLVGGHKLLFPLHHETIRLAMDQEGNSQLFHMGQSLFNAGKVGDSVFALGGDPRRIELDPDNVGSYPFQHFPGVGFEKKCHVRFEGVAADSIADLCRVACQCCW